MGSTHDLAIRIGDAEREAAMSMLGASAESTDHYGRSRRRVHPHSGRFFALGGRDRRLGPDRALAHDFRGFPGIHRG